jgi:hypothetical protein
VGPQLPLPVHQQPPQIPWVWPWVGSECLQSPGKLLDCVSVCQTEGGKKAVRCLPDLTWPPRGVQALQVDSRATGPTSKVKLDVRRRGPGGQRDPEDWQSWSWPVRQALLEAPPRSRGAGSSSTRTTPTPFVNCVDCKSNTIVFFTLLVVWVPPGAACWFLFHLSLSLGFCSSLPLPGHHWP